MAAFRWILLGALFFGMGTGEAADKPAIVVPIETSDKLVRATVHHYPWKAGIKASVIWIGRAPHRNGSPNNFDGAWTEAKGLDAAWLIDHSDSGGYVYMDSILLNPYYVSLPFDDLAHPAEARRWIPNWWYKAIHPGAKSISVCKDRWVEIKNADGKICYAQWEDAGPGSDVEAGYVFGTDRPDSKMAGITVSPAVAKYLDLGRSHVVSWRFIDTQELEVGVWIDYLDRTIAYVPIPGWHVWQHPKAPYQEDRFGP